MKREVVIPAQVRAGRALLDWSQEKLADEAGIALTSVRDIESQKRATGTGIVDNIRRALENAGVVFVSGNATEGAGVRFVANRLHIIRRPTVAKWENVSFDVEWQGRSLTVSVSYEAIEDLGRLKGNEPASAFLAAFEKHRGAILEGVKRAATDKNNFDGDLLRVRSKDIPGLA